MLKINDGRILPLLLAAAVAAPTLGAAQEAAPIGAGEWVIGHSLGLPGNGRQAFPPAMTVGVHFLRLPTTWPIGTEVSVGTAPIGFFSGTVPVGVRAVVNLPLRPSTTHVFLPSAGIGLVGFAGAGGLRGVAGVNLGVTYAAFGALRVGVTWSWLPEEVGRVWLLELGFLGLPGS